MDRGPRDTDSTWNAHVGLKEPGWKVAVIASSEMNQRVLALSLLLLGLASGACRRTVPVEGAVDGHARGAEMVEIAVASGERVVAAPGLEIETVAVGYAHLEDSGNLEDAELQLIYQGETTVVRLFRESPDDPDARVRVGPYVITLLGVNAYGNTTAFLGVQTASDTK